LLFGESAAQGFIVRIFAASDGREIHHLSAFCLPTTGRNRNRPCFGHVSLLGPRSKFKCRSYGSGYDARTDPANLDSRRQNRFRIPTSSSSEIPQTEQESLVGSGAGAVIRRKLLGCIRRFRLSARLGVSVIPFPAPATSHAACRFTALRALAHFTTRFMGPKTGPSPGCIVGVSGPAD
jgi:hypothetical protein